MAAFILIAGINEGRIQRTQERHNIRELKVVDSLNDISFKQTFRLTRTGFEEIFNDLAPHLKQGQSNYSISIETKILVVVRLLAQGSYQLGVGNDVCLSVSQSAVSSILREVLDVMNAVLCTKYIIFPTRQMMRKTATEFLRKYRIPNVIGMVDGTHISIVGPRNDAEFPEFVYVNRKNFHSINTQIICDHEYRIFNVNARYPGSAHDSFIWKNCSIRQHLLDNYANDNVWLLGDSGYPLEPILLTPFRNPQSEGAALFNEYHSKCRSTVERCIGVLKGRWRCLKLERGLHYHPTIAGKIINACAALHNFCIVQRDEDYLNLLVEPEGIVPGHEAGIFDDDLFRTGSQIRDNIIGYMLQRA